MIGRGRLLLSAGAAGSGAFVGASVGVWRLALYQGGAADGRVRPLTTPAPPVREFYGNPTHPPFTLGILGDSSAQGTGVHDYDDTLGGWLARALAADRDGDGGNGRGDSGGGDSGGHGGGGGGGRHVRVVSAARDGARAEHLAAQVARVAPAAPDLAVISIGVNDIRNRTSPAAAARHLAGAVTDLRRGGAEVIVGTTPDLSVISAVRSPLREVLWLLGLLLERAQTPAVAAAGGTPVTLRTAVSRRFAADPTLFAPDGLHASPRGNALIGAHLLAAYRPSLRT
ncbi:SGNH/GDSL hydrolase family protein [Frankia sp. QA3]|uniref:SGNH/GDSL hydrolase family protein n=1 Tax=Frankia sp. QA3 TaxID=710111 RepID=UPI000269BBB3|nr:SGNH/GDSL hydrolase family protein [Frankia sp. QA3]EIV91728.1 GDSL-like Lipase/Acylhydrolase [Frankia sp. QA3]